MNAKEQILTNYGQDFREANRKLREKIINLEKVIEVLRKKLDKKS